MKQMHPTKPILLLFPPYEGKSYLKSRFPFPTGLLYLSAYLNEKGIESEVFDFSYPSKMLKAKRPALLKGTKVMRWVRYGWKDIEIYEWLKTHLPKYHNIIGISSMMSTNYTGFYRVVEILKDINPNITVIAGGPHATLESNHIFRNSETDYICRGEGEEAFFNFIYNPTIEAHPAIIGRESPDAPHQRAFIENMDILPFPKRSLLKDNRKTPQMYVTFSRGCPHRCRFCGSYKIQGRKWRPKSVTQVIKEIKFYQKEWGVKTFIVEDDNASPNKNGIKWMKNICKKIIKAKIKARFRISHGIPVYATADKDLCDLMWEAGFRGMVFPLESSNPKVLQHMKKAHRFGTYKKAIKNWNYEKNQPTETIIGYPFIDTIESMLKTIIDVAEVGAISWPSYFRLVKGSPLFITCARAKYFEPKSYDPIMAQDFHIETNDWSISDLREIRQIARASNFGIENGFNIFKDDLRNIVGVGKFSFFVPPAGPLKQNQIVATGSFGFNRGQTKVAEVLLARFDTSIKGKPTCRTHKDKKSIRFAGYKSSRVFFTLKQMLKGEKK